MKDLLLEYFKVDQAMYEPCTNERFSELDNIKERLTKRIIKEVIKHDNL